ncbi:hypothetical protein, partial [Pseudomonas syringae group genomosp. 7]|uniref:hypothetical protein n=1 Tax=Pseudomonas syringae group genomosp. 7 TaxID=251699 RepID=UPI00376FDF5B
RGQTMDYRALGPRLHDFRGALRHKSAPHRTFKIGRGASRAAFPRWSVGTRGAVSQVGFYNIRLEMSRA